MDWSRAKNILILVFIALNIFLFSFIMISDRKDKAISAAIRDTEKILSVNNIRLECKIPDFSRDMGILDYSDAVIDREKIAKELLGTDTVDSGKINDGQPISANGGTLTFTGNSSFVFKGYKKIEGLNISNQKEAEKYLRNLCSNIGISLSGYLLDEAENEPDGSIRLTLVNTYKKSFKVFDSYIKACLSKDGLKEMECNVKNIGEENGSAQILAAYQILLANFHQPDTVIKSIEFGFKGYKPEYDSKGYSCIPVWRVRTQSGESYFKAYTGEEITTVSMANLIQLPFCISK